mmetsp:Transcript_28333/g.44193  ORF Transcript_28333/g.44193 Transcript_28333/m.44193 type:complete len:535 (-) Transcript_28333:444-2048(-)
MVFGAESHASYGFESRTQSTESRDASKTPRAWVTPRSQWQTTPTRTPRTPRTPPHHTPRTRKTPTTTPRRRTKQAPSWGDELEGDLELDEGQGNELDFWGKLWQQAGYTAVGGGEYVRTHIPVQGSLPSEFAISGMAREEQRRLDTEEDGPEPLEEEKGNRYGLLAEYARFGEVDKAKELLQVASRSETLHHYINYQDRLGWTPLHWAAECNPEKMTSSSIDKRLTIMRLLLEYPATIDLKLISSRGNTPLVHAIWNGNLKACQLLLKKKGMDANAATEQGWTAMHWAANGMHMVDNTWSSLPEIVQLLMRRRHDISLDACTNSGDTPLHIATMRGYAQIVRILVLARSPIDLGNQKGLTPLHLAATHGHDRLVRILLQFRADRRILDSQRRTPAHVLALQIMNDIMRMRFPDFGKADDFDKKHLRERFEEWLSEHSFPKSLTSPQVEVDQVMALKDKAHVLQEAPDGLSDEDVDKVLDKLETLELLKFGLPSESNKLDLHFSRTHTSPVTSRAVSPVGKRLNVEGLGKRVTSQ